MKTGYILMYRGTTLFSKSIRAFMSIFRLRQKEPDNWAPSHMGTILVDDDGTVKIGESVWPKYKINDFYSNYTKNYIILKPVIDFTNEECEIGKVYMKYLENAGKGYQWWKYPAYILYTTTGIELFFGKDSDLNNVCYESTLRLAAMMRKTLLPKNYNFEKALCFDILENPKFEIFEDKR